LITAAKGCGLPGGGLAGCGVPGATPEALGPTALAASGAFDEGLDAALAAEAAAAPLPTLLGAIDAQPPSTAISTGASTGVNDKRPKVAASGFMVVEKA
jgi:hypothetical protein